MNKVFVGAILALFVLPHAILAADPRIDVSRVIDKTQAATILGEAVKDSTPRNGGGADGYYSKCNYYSVNRGKSLVIRLHVPSSDAIGPQKELQLLAATDSGMQSVPDLGDAAKMTVSGGDTGFASRILMLYVAKGNAFVTIGLGGFADDAVALGKAKAVAQKLLVNF